MIEAFVVCAVLSASPVDEVVARVAAEPITQGQLKARLAATRARGGAVKYDLLLEDLINDSLLAREGYAAGLGKARDVVARVAAERARLAAELLVEQEIASTAKVTDEQVRQMYHSSGDSVRYNLLVVGSEAEATALLKRLRGGSTFAAEASKSLDPAAAARAGDSGPKTRGQLEGPLVEAVFSAPLNALTGPVKLELGYGVLQVVSRQIADEAGLTARRRELGEFLEKQLKAQYRHHYVVQLRAKGKVTIDEDFLKSTGLRLTATPDEAKKVIATAGGKPIRYEEVLEQVMTTVGNKEGGHFSGASVKLEFSWALVDRALLEAAALERGFGTNPAVEEAVKRFERDEVARAAAKQVRASVPPLSDAEIASWYGQHPADFLRPAERACSHLVVREQSHATGMRARMEKGEPFEDLAREYSLDEATGQKGGVIGVLNDDRLSVLAKTEPQLAAAFKDGKPNQVSAPTASKLGWHLVRCGAVTPASTVPLPQVREGIAARLRVERETQAVVHHLEKLRGQVVITRDTAALSRIPPPSP